MENHRWLSPLRSPPRYFVLDAVTWEIILMSINIKAIGVSYHENLNIIVEKSKHRTVLLKSFGFIRNQKEFLLSYFR